MSAVPQSFLCDPATPRRGCVELAGVWRGSQLAHAAALRVQPTGHAALDAQLPGGGWPRGALAEVLQPPHGRHEWPLVLPTLACAAAHGPGRIVLVAPPCEPFAPVLQAAGLPAWRLCWIDATAAEAAWACEQALRCRDVLAVLAWLPQARPEALRRLQLAAAQQQALLWAFRSDAALRQASPAPLRLAVRGVPEGLEVRLVKRRGPPLLEPLLLPAHAPPLAQVLAAARARRAAVQAPAALPRTMRWSPGHALDRLVRAAG